MPKKTIIFSGVLIAVIIALVLVLAFKKEREYYYLLELNYNKGEITLLDSSLVEGHADKPLYEPEDGWKVEFLSFKNEVLFSSKFYPNVINIFWKEPEPGKEVPEGEREMPTGPIYLDNIDFLLALPYFKEGKTINIYNPEGKLKLSVDVSKIPK